MAVLEVHNLTKKFQSHVVVNHIDLQIEKGQLVAFLGHNGAGKSTTINMLMGLLKPDAGEITINGLHPKSNGYTHSIGAVFQDSVLDDELTVQQNLRMVAKLYKNYDSAFQSELENKFEIEKIKSQKYSSLSGGQRRRVDIVRSLLSKPEILFLDEPSTGLDIQTRNKIWDVLNEIRHEMGLTIILTTHYLEEADQSDWVYVLDKGKVIASDTVDNLKSQYALNTLTLYFTDSFDMDEKIKMHGAKINNNKVIFKVAQFSDALKLIEQYRESIVDFQYEHGTMDDIFISLTGKEIK